MTLGEAIGGSTTDICLTGAALGCLYMMVASFLVLRFGRKTSPATCQAVPVTILVPLCGDEPGLYERLVKLCDQDYGAPIQVLCGVQRTDDPAIAVVRQLERDRPDRKIELHIDSRRHGRNLKISNLINMTRWARHDVLVSIDSDIEIGPTYLAQAVAALQQPGTGAVTCLYHGMTSDGGLWTRLMAMGINLHFLPNVIVALNYRLARPCFGATIAIERRTLTQIGGFEAFAEQLWDDYAIGEAVRDLGLDVTVTSSAAGHVCSGCSAQELMSKEVRYARTIRGIEPIGHAGGIITHPLPLALLAAFAGASDQAAAMAVLALACRLILCWCVEYRFGLRPPSYWLLPLRDLLSFTVYIASFFGATVVWRGQRYRIRPDGTLLPDAK